MVRDLRRGEVVSYREVARRAGYPAAARAVGNVLASSVGLPWWRVIRADGSFAAHNSGEQAARLRREGVVVRELSPSGVVRVRGETWTAESPGEPVPAGAKVKVVAVRGLTLEVVPETAEQTTEVG